MKERGHFEESVIKFKLQTDLPTSVIRVRWTLKLGWNSKHDMLNNSSLN